MVSSGKALKKNMKNVQAVNQNISIKILGKRFKNQSASQVWGKDDMLVMESVQALQEYVNVYNVGMNLQKLRETHVEILFVQNVEDSFVVLIKKLKKEELNESSYNIKWA